MATLEEKLNWITRPLTPPIPEEEFVSHLNVLNENLSDMIKKVAEVSKGIGKKLGAAGADTEKPAQDEGQRVVPRGKDAGTYELASPSLPDALEPLESLLKDIGSHYPKSTKTLESIMNRISKLSESHDIGTLSGAILKWVDGKLVPSLEERYKYAQNENVIAHKFLNRIVELRADLKNRISQFGKRDREQEQQATAA